MNAKQIEKIIEKGEGQEAEFKAKFTNEVGKDICAFANTNDGIILIGIDNSRNTVGVDKKADEQIANIATSCDLPIRVTVETEVAHGKNILVVKVKKSEQIHSWRGKVYIRVGSTNRALSMQEILELGQKLGKIRFDEQVCEDAKIDDIDENKVRWYLERRAMLKVIEVPTIPYQQVLINLEVMIKKNDILQLTNSGILFFGKYPQRFFSHCEVKLGRFKGTNMVEFIDRAEIHGTLTDLIDEAEKFIKRNTRMATKIVGFEQVNITEYPYEAIREAIINAVTHRDYFFTGASIRVMIFDDRIEVESPGNLPEGITLRNLEGSHVLRNENLANLLYDIGYIEKWGTGIRRMKDLMRNHGLAEPIFEESSRFFKVTFYGPGDKILDLVKPKGRVDLRELGLNDRQIEALKLMVNEEVIFSNRKYREYFKVSNQTCIRDMKLLVELGFVSREGVGKSVVYKSM